MKTNPIIKGDVPDISLIRVNNAYYMVSTTMYFCPVAPIMKSYDLINWKIVSYCADIIEDLPNFRLETEDEERIGDYGRGQWASSLRFINGKFWVLFTNNTTTKSYLFNTSDIEKENWKRIEFDRRFHDPSIFFDEEKNKMYIIHGAGDIWLTEMKTDLSAVKSDGTDTIIIPTPDIAGGCKSEGSHIYKLNGYYYLFIISWEFGRQEFCYKASNIEGPWEGRIVLNKGFDDRNAGVAQGGIVDTPNGEWYGFFFQDRGAVGRIPVLVPMRWSDDFWPVFGDENGNIPKELPVNTLADYEQNIFTSDDFDSDTLPLAWQWNHNPDNDNWSLAKRPGFLRLQTGRTSKTIFHARNTLTQRTREPSCEGIACLEPIAMKDGDVAGLVVLQAVCGFVGIEQEDGKKYIVMYTGDNDSEQCIGKNATVTRHAKVPFSGDRIFLKANCEFFASGKSTETAHFSYSLDGEKWERIGTTVILRYTLTHFTGARFGLFNYAIKEADGYVDFDFFRYI